uniref:Protein tweety homolog n=1 Tax=Petromyzon marinus TaxID=7757 RepID=A0AAJ7XK36_PETMA|nr:protein tweety homolog 1-like isoform X1 [Petromyzon marinus]
MAFAVNYTSEWWVSWLHSFPHVSFGFQLLHSDFQPQAETYLQSLVFLVGIAAAGLALNLLVLFVYFVRLCCCRRHEDEAQKRSNVCCTTWCIVMATLICSGAIGVGFYGNSETNDGVQRLTASLHNANSTVHTVDTLVLVTESSLREAVGSELLRLEEAFAKRPEFLRLVRRACTELDGLLQQLAGVPFWGRGVSLERTAHSISFVEFYRWLAYLLLLILDIIICLLVLLGLSKQSRCLLILMLLLGILMLIVSWGTLGVEVAVSVGVSDFCMAPEKYITNLTQEYSIMSKDVLQYYLHCSLQTKNPFLRKMTGSLRILSDLQSLVLELIIFAVQEFPAMQKELWNIQGSLNATETSIHQLTALVNCRSLHKDYVEALNGVCSEGLKGMLFLALFSIVSALMFNSVICIAPKTWRNFRKRERQYEDMDEDEPCRQPPGSTRRPPLPSFYSYSSFGSQTSIQPTSQSITNAPVSEYVNQNTASGNNPRHENVPLIGRNSPPPSRCPSRATSGRSRSRQSNGWETVKVMEERF